MITRRTFLTSSAFAAVAAAGHPARRSPPIRDRLAWHTPPEDLPRATDPELKVLALQALDAATAAGATYADVRFTSTRRRTFQGGAPPVESTLLAVGVRALAKGQGVWGFAAHSVWTPELVTQLGRQAAEQAQLPAWAQVPPIELVDPPPTVVGNWVMPVRRDPFSVPVDETTAWLQSVTTRVQQLGGRVAVVLTFERQERTFASTAGAYTTQTVYTSLGGAPHQQLPPSQIVLAVPNPRVKAAGVYALPFVTPTGAGYEIVEEAKLLDHLPEWVATARELATAKPFETLGEYDVVFDGAAMAAIVDGTFGAALEYDRAVGYEANAGGTSYLAPPPTILGMPHAPAAVTITGDRTLARGAATVQWDDEGVMSQPFPLVKGGVVVDYASSREFVNALVPWYQRQGRPARSNACAVSESAFTVPLVYTPNLVLHPADRDTRLETLIAGVDRGFLVSGGTVQMDFQQRSGRGQGAQVYAIQHGKLAGPVKDAVYRFRSEEFWKKLVRLGGASTAMLRGLATSKGQPNQGTVHSVHAVAAHVGNIQVDNASRA